jgi:hypothetical protein
MLAPLSLPDLFAQGGPGLSLGFRLGAGSLGQVARLQFFLTEKPEPVLRPQARK